MAGSMRILFVECNPGQPYRWSRWHVHPFRRSESTSTMAVAFRQARGFCGAGANGPRNDRLSAGRRLPGGERDAGRTAPGAGSERCEETGRVSL